MRIGTTHTLPLSSPIMQLSLVYPGTNPAPCPGHATPLPFSSGSSLQEWSSHWKRRGGDPPVEFAGSAVSHREVSPGLGALQAPRTPAALKSGCYWPKVSAPSGKLTFHWPALSHVTFLSCGRKSRRGRNKFSWRLKRELGQVMP